jgi:hypothetical protein
LVLGVVSTLPAGCDVVPPLLDDRALGADVIFERIVLVIFVLD